jgi:hypothetical protein
MNLYLSEFCVKPDIAIRKSYENAIDTVLRCCSENNVSCFRSEAHDDYGAIEERIKNANIFVAIIDEYWMSSTWKLFEYTYASGGQPITGKSKISIVPKILVFLSGNIELPKFIENSPGKVSITNNLMELENELLLSIKA